MDSVPIRVDQEVHALRPALRLVAVLDLERHPLLQLRLLSLPPAAVLVEEVEEEEEDEEGGRGEDEPLGDRPQPLQVQPARLVHRHRRPTRWAIAARIHDGIFGLMEEYTQYGL